MMRLRKVAVSVFAFAALAGFGTMSVDTAVAGPVFLAVDGTHSALSLKIEMFAASRSASTSLTVPSQGPTSTNPMLGYFGLLGGNGPGNTPGFFDSNGGGNTIGNGSLTVGLGALGSETFTYNALHGTLSGSPGFLTPITPTPGSPGSAGYSLSGMTYTLDGGTIAYAGAGLVASQAPPGTFDFGTSPAAMNLAAGNATLLLGAGPPTNQPVTISIPITVTTTTFLGMGPDAKFTISGTLVFTGVTIPEPGSCLLLALGLCGLVPIVRRRLQG